MKRLSRILFCLFLGSLAFSSSAQDPEKKLSPDEVKARKTQILDERRNRLERETEGEAYGMAGEWTPDILLLFSGLEDAVPAGPGLSVKSELMEAHLRKLSKMATITLLKEAGKTTETVDVELGRPYTISAPRRTDKNIGEKLVQAQIARKKNPNFRTDLVLHRHVLFPAKMVFKTEKNKGWTILFGVSVDYTAEMGKEGLEESADVIAQSLADNPDRQFRTDEIKKLGIK